MAGMLLPASIQESLETTKSRQLGLSGLGVSVPILGAMSLGSRRWVPWMVEKPEALEILKAAFEHSINTWATANAYSNGISEEILGKAIKKFNIPREKLVIMTTCFLYVGDEPGANAAKFAEQVGQSKDYVDQGGECNVFGASWFDPID
jgi:aryl-alcohol dehydrogenase-like predicted oxidoreductase